MVGGGFIGWLFQSVAVISPCYCGAVWYATAPELVWRLCSKHDVVLAKQHHVSIGVLGQSRRRHSLLQYAAIVAHSFC